MISPEPDVRTLRIEPATDPFMVLACDGIWNSMSSQEVVDFVAERIAKAPTKISSICEEVSIQIASTNRKGLGDYGVASLLGYFGWVDLLTWL